MLGKIPPQSIEAEQAIIGCMLLDKIAVSETTRFLTPEDFFNPMHAEMYSQILDSIAKNKPIDIVTVSDLGFDIEYLSQLTDIPTTSNFKHYVNIVKSKSIRRQYIKASQRIMDLSYEGIYDNITDFKNDIMQLMDIEIKDNKKQSSSIKDIAIKTLNNIQERYNNKEPGKLLYGIKGLDKFTGGAHGCELTILAARPSVGKTGLSNQIALNMACRENHVAIFNLEMTDEQLTERMISNLSGVDSEKIRTAKYLDDNEWGKIGVATSQLNDLPLHIFDSITKIEEIRSECRTLKNKGKLDYIIIDYLQLMDTMKKTENSNARVSHLSRQCKLLGKELRIPILLLSQLSRSGEQEKRRPKLSDLRDSGSIEQDADNVFFLHDPEYGNYKSDTDQIKIPVELIIAKQRNGKRDVCFEIGYIKTTQRLVNM